MSEEATSKLIVRCTPSLKGRYVNAAQKAGKKLEAWVLEALNEKLEKEQAERDAQK